MNNIEKWLLIKMIEINPDTELQDLYTGKMTFGGRLVINLLESYYNETVAKNLPILKINQQSELLNIFNDFYAWHKQKGYNLMKSDDFEEYLTSI